MYKKIGILGGMGPSASANFYKLLIDTAQKSYGAVQDDEYPEMIIYNIALKDFGENASVDQESIKKQLVNGVKLLENAGADFVVIACNTVHFHYQAMQDAINIPIINIVHITTSEVKKSSIKKVGLVCSEGTNEIGLYSKYLESQSIECISPNKDNQNSLNNIILNVMGGNNGEGDKEVLKSIFDEYNKEGAEAMVLGCTELPLAISQKDTKYKLFDTLQILADHTLKFAYGK